MTPAEDGRKILEGTFFPPEPKALAHLIATTPSRIPDFINRTHAALSLAGTDDQAMGVVATFSENIARELSRFEPDQPLGDLSADEGIFLLDTLAEVSFSKHPVDRHLKTVVMSIVDAWVNKQFESTSDWRGSLTALHTLTEAAFESTRDIQRIEAWMSLFTPGSGIFRKQSIARLSLFAVFHNPAPDAEPYLRKAMDIQYAHVCAAKTLGRPEELKRYRETRDLEVLFAREMQKPHPLPAFADAIAAIGKYPDRFRRLQHYLSSHQVQNVQLDFRHAKPVTIAQEYPDNLVTKETYITHQATNMVDLYTLDQDAYTRMEEIASTMNPPGVVIPIRGDVAGYVSVSSAYVSGDATPQSLTELATSLLNRYNIVQQYKQHIHLIESTSQAGGLEFSIPGQQIVFYILKERFRTQSELEAYFDITLPELSFNGLSLLQEVRSLQSEAARTFNRALTRAGVSFELTNHPNLPGVFDQAQLRLEQPGLFSFQLTPTSHPEWGYTTLPTISGTIQLTGGRADVQFEADVPDLPPHQEWFLKQSILQLFQSQCCLSHDQIPFVEERLLEGEEHGPVGVDIPGMIVHIGAKKKTGEPGMFTMQALLNHLFDAYGLQLPPSISLEEAVLAVKAMKGVSLIDINVWHRHTHQGCPKNFTWRVSHIAGGVIGNPIPAEAPGNLFSH